MASDPKIPDDEPPLHCWDAYKHVIVEGHNHNMICEKYGVTRQTSWNWCNKVARWLSENIKEEIGQLKVNLLKRLEYVYGEAVQAHEKLKSDEVTTVEESQSPKVEDVEQAPAGELVPTKRRVTKRTKHGDPAFLAVALQSVQAMVKLYQHEMDVQENSTGMRYAGKEPGEILVRQIEFLKARHAKLLARGTVPAASGGGEGDRA